MSIPTGMIRGCTQVIERGRRETLENRTKAFSNRGNAYGLKRDYDHAIANFTKAIALDPEDAGTYAIVSLRAGPRGQDACRAPYNFRVYASLRNPPQPTL